MKEYISVVLSLLDCTLLWQLKEMSDSLRTMLGKYVVPSYTVPRRSWGYVIPGLVAEPPICEPWHGPKITCN